MPCVKVPLPPFPKPPKGAGGPQQGEEGAYPSKPSTCSHLDEAGQKRRLTQVGKLLREFPNGKIPLMGWHQAGPGHGAQALSWGQSSPGTRGLGHLLSALRPTRALLEGIFREQKAFCHAEKLCSPASPDLGSVPAQLHVGSPCALIQPGLSHLQLNLFVPYGLLDDLDLCLDLEDFLPCLG